MSRASALLPILLLTLGCTHPAQPHPTQPAVTTLTITSKTLHPNVQRFGINLSGQGFYDSGQLLRNLVARNSGFEGETWQTILRCHYTSATTCTEANQYTVWPVDFLKGAHYTWLSGPAKGLGGTVLANSTPLPPLGETLTLTPIATQAKPNDFLLVRIDKPGSADAGWWLNPSPGATYATESKDLSPNTPGKQALRLTATAPNQNLTLNSYFDTYNGRSFVQLHGSYRLQFRAKLVTGTRPLEVRLQRLDTTHGMETFFLKDLTLTPTWHDYTFDFPTHEDGTPVGGVVLGFSIRESAILIDDVTLTPTAHPANNPTAFRDEVVQTLRDLHPGVLRYMDNGGNFGSSLDTLLTPPLARQRTGSSTQATLMEDVSIGLHEFLALCQAIGADPWFSMPPGFSPAESANLIEYLSGPASTPYGARRAALGQPKPWSEVFPTIHLELGNEQWNAGSFAGQTIADPTAYALRANDVFSSARHSPWFRPASYDLILGTWSAVPWWTGEELKANTQADSTAIAPYLFTEFNDSTTPERIFGPMLAEPELEDSRQPGKHTPPAQGIVLQQLHAAQTATHPVHLAVYEVNLGILSGSATQAALDAAVPSLGAGLAVIDHMLLMLRDAGITTQALFALPEYVNQFTSSVPGAPRETVPLWGAVVDMGGATNLRRPQFLALQLANKTILQTMLATQISGPDPTWDQPLSTNDKVELEGAHDLQTFAFADGPHRSLILLNLSRTASHALVFAGPNAPRGTVAQTLLTSPNLTDNNEAHETIKLVSSRIPTFNPNTPYNLPPHSLVTLTWNLEK